VLSYLGILSLIPYFAKKDDPDPEIRWHAKNGLGLFIVELIVWAVVFVASMVLRNSFLGCGLAALNCVMWLGFLVISIICIVKGIGGQRYRYVERSRWFLFRTSAPSFRPVRRDGRR
jgi:hypothetical protein